MIPGYPYLSYHPAQVSHLSISLPLPSLTLIAHYLLGGFFLKLCKYSILFTHMQKTQTKVIIAFKGDSFPPNTLARDDLMCTAIGTLPY